MLISNVEIAAFCGALLGATVLWDIFNKVIFPKIVNYRTKEIECNPKWITSRLQYYGFDDIDFILCESKLGILPRFRASKDNRLQLLIDDNITVDHVEDLGRLALAAKIKAKYGVWFPEKPIYWLSILCYMLDGGEIQMSNISWEENKKRLD